MVDKTPAELDPGTPSDTSIVHASENGVSTNSKGHDERDISRLQGTAPDYSASKTYNLNDLVTESGTVFRNTTAITVPETFTPSKWVSVGGGLTQDLIEVRNTTGSLISKGSAVYVSGSSGNKTLITAAEADAISTMPSIGLVLADISNNSDGFVVVQGIITGLDTSSFLVGDTLFVSALTAGDLTSTAPVHPNLRQSMGVVLVSNVSIGEIQVITGDVSGAESGTIFNTFAVGDGLAGTKAVSFVNAAGTFIADSAHTANRTQSFQDVDGTIALLADVATVPSLLLHNTNTETVTADPDFFALGGGDIESSIEVNAQNSFPTPIKTQNMTIVLTANSGGVSTLRMKKNGADGNQVIVIPASTTGIFRDVTNNDDFGTGDVGNYDYENDGDGSQTVNSLACEVVSQ